MGSDAKNRVPRLEAFQDIAKGLGFEVQVHEETNALSAKVSKGEIELTVVFGDFKKVRIWKSSPIFTELITEVELRNRLISSQNKIQILKA